MQATKETEELYPWIGGYNPSVDPIILNPQQLQTAENLQFVNDGGRSKRGGITYVNNASTAVIKVGSVGVDLVYGTDYWANVSGTKRSYHVTVSSGGAIFRSPNSGNYTRANSASTAVISVTRGQLSSEVFNEDMILGYSKAAVPKVWDNQNSSTNFVPATAATGTYPSGWILRSHRNRLWVAGTSANPDRVYYSGFTAGVPDHRAWNTASSAGFIDIFPGDGDPEGITSIFPEINKGGLYIAKRTKIYFVDTSNSDDSLWSVSLVSNGIGCTSHNAAVAVDQIDVVFPSDRGIHSLAQVISQAGIIEGKFLSKDIHYDYHNVLFTADRSQYSAVWYPQLNSYFLSVSSSSNNFDRIYAYNIDLQQWFVWTSHTTVNKFNFLHLRFNGTSKSYQFYGLSNKGRVLKFDGTNYYDQSGTATISQISIPFKIKTSILFPGKPRSAEKHFTDLLFYCSSKSSSAFNVSYKIDNGGLQNFSVNQIATGSNILGTTLLGPAFILGKARGVKPYISPIKGVGSCIEIEIQHSSSYRFDLFGMGIKFKQANESYNSRRNFANT